MSSAPNPPQTHHPFTWLTLQSLQLYHTLFFSTIESKILENAPETPQKQVYVRNLELAEKVIFRGRRKVVREMKYEKRRRREEKLGAHLKEEVHQEEEDLLGRDGKALEIVAGEEAGSTTQESEATNAVNLSSLDFHDLQVRSKFAESNLTHLPTEQKVITKSGEEMIIPLVNPRGKRYNNHVIVVKSLSIPERVIFQTHRKLCIKYEKTKCWVCWVRSVGGLVVQGGMKGGCICGRLQKVMSRMKDKLEVFYEQQKELEKEDRAHSSASSLGLFPKPIQFYLLFNAQEIWNASNSGKLLFHLFPRSTQFAIVGLEEEKIRNWVLSIRAEAGGKKKVLVLFPHRNAVPISKYFALVAAEERAMHRATGQATPLSQLFQHLFILDTTWKAAKQLAKNLLRDFKDDIQFVSLDLSQISEQSNRFALKRQSREREQSRRLCTIEAVSEAFKELGYPPHYSESINLMLDVLNEYILRSKGRYELQRERHPEKFVGAATFDQDDGADEG